MEDADNKRFIYQFGKFTLDPQERSLLIDGQPIHLPAKEFETLLLLVENSGHALSKEEIISAVWRESFVEEGNLSQKISNLRKILNRNGDKLIETLPKHGYRFSAEVSRVFEPQETVAESLNGKDEIEIEKTSPLLPPKRTIFTVPRVFAALFVLLAAGAGVWFWLGRARAERVNSIAVLPLKSLSAEENDKALGFALTDALITKIGGLRQIAVRSTGAVGSYADTQQPDALEAGRKLQVDAVLEGTILQSEGRVRIYVRLVRILDGEQIWAEKFEGEAAKIFDLEDRLTEQTAQALRLRLGASENEQITRRSTDDASAFDAYAKGRYFWNQRTEQSLKKAVGFFYQATEKDPNYARAYSGLADCYILLGIWGAMPPTDAMPKAKQAATNALEKDEALAEAHTSLAFVRWVYDWDWKGSDEGFQTAIRLDPNYATAHQWYAYFLASAGRFDEAISHINKAREIEGSLSLSISTDIGEIYCWAGQYDKAIGHLGEVVRLAPEFASARNALGIAYLKKGNIREALTELETARRLDNSPRMMSSLGYAYGVSGEREKALQIIEELKKLSRERYVSSFSLAVVHAGLGEQEEAVVRLEEAYRERSDTMAVLGVYPLLDNLRANPRFIKLAERVGISRR